jgi:hypothetical protein
MANERAVLDITSAGIERDGSTYVLLTWEDVEEVQGYNLYRSVAGAPPRKSRPINGSTPIRRAQSGRELTAVLPEGSPGFEALAQGFAAVRRLRGGSALELADPKGRFDAGLSADEEALFDAAAKASLEMRLAAGLAYIDRKVEGDEHYVYDLRGVLVDGSEVELASRVPVWAGHFTLPDPPSGITTQVGDRRVLVLWNRNRFAYSFIVQRSTNPGGPFQQVNPKPIVYDIDANLDGTAITTTPLPSGFLDIQEWDPEGFPTWHPVEGVGVVGPDNAKKYYYRIASRYSLDRAGPWSSPVEATPVRSIEPMAPIDLQVLPNTSNDGLVVTWRKVTRNVEGHQMPSEIQTYSIHRAPTRADLEDLDHLALWQVATRPADPQDLTTPTLGWTDLAPILVPPYGETPFFYRVRVADPYGNTSAPSAVITGRVPDTRPPGATTPDGAEGFADRITVRWLPNSEPDLAGYQIYRGICDYGQLYIPGVHPKPPKKDDRKDDQSPQHDEPRGGCDMTLVGQVSLADAEDMFDAENRIWFDDDNVPEGSPLCYAYWVRAFDMAGNLYQGNGGCPARREEYVCVRLRERTPPPVPVLTGLRARNSGVLVEWISSPVQDLHAFHVYRSDKEFDPPQFLACVFTDGTVSATPWKGLPPTCSDVPAEPDPLAARGSYLDGTAEAHHVYWYRVSALDWLGNESDGSPHLDDIPSSSTFAFTSDLPDTPTVLAQPTPTIAGCGLDVGWGPTFDPAAVQGFVVFRQAAGGPWRQVSDVLTDNTFTDPTARRGVDYLYCVQSIDRVGTLSHPSMPVLHRY